MEYIIAAMLAVAIVLLIVLLIKQGKAGSGKAEEKIDNLASTLGAEFERSRRESSEAQRDMRAETAKSLGEMSEKLEKLRLENTGWQGRIEKSLAESLSAMQLNNIEQNEKQSRALTEAVDKMRESNEKKLEQMRVTVDEKLTSTLSQRLAQAITRTVQAKRSPVSSRSFA